MNKGIVASIFSYVIWGFLPYLFSCLIQRSGGADNIPPGGLVIPFYYAGDPDTKRIQILHWFPYLEESRYLLHGWCFAGN